MLLLDLAKNLIALLAYAINLLNNTINNSVREPVHTISIFARTLKLDLWLVQSEIRIFLYNSSANTSPEFFTTTLALKAALLPGDPGIRVQYKY